MQAHAISHPGRKWGGDAVGGAGGGGGTLPCGRTRRVRGGQGPLVSFAFRQWDLRQPRGPAEHREGHIGARCQRREREKERKRQKERVSER